MTALSLTLSTGAAAWPQKEQNAKRSANVSADPKQLECLSTQQTDGWTVGQTEEQTNGQHTSNDGHRERALEFCSLKPSRVDRPRALPTSRMRLPPSEGPVTSVGGPASSRLARYETRYELKRRAGRSAGRQASQPACQPASVQRVFIQNSAALSNPLLFAFSKAHSRRTTADCGLFKAGTASERARPLECMETDSDEDEN